MDSSGGNYHHPGAQDEPFFDLLQQSAPISAPKTGYPNPPTYNAPKKMENAADFNFAGDDVLPSFDFQPIRTTPASSSSNTGGGLSSGAAVRIEEGRQGSPPASYSSYEPMVRRSREPPPTYETPVSRPHEHEKESFDSATAAAVERTMKKYADNLLRVLEGMTGRLSQLESSTQRLEHLFEEIKNVVADTHAEADGKLRSLESHILEVHRGVQVLRDRQEIFEAQSQLAKLQLAKGDSGSLSTPSAPPPPPPPPPAPGASESTAQLSRASSGKALMEAPPKLQVSDTPSSSYYQPQPQLQLQHVPALPSPVPQQPLPPPQQPPPHQQHALQQQQQQHQVQPQQQQQQLQQPIQLQQPGLQQNEGSHQTYNQQQGPPPPQQLSHPPQHQPQPSHQPAAYSQQQQQQPPYTQQQQPTSQPPPMPSYGHPPELPPYGQHPQGPPPPPPPPLHHVSLPPSSYPSDLPSYHPSYGPPPPPRPALPPQQQPSPSPQPQQPHNIGMYEPSMGRAGSGQLSLPAPPYLPQGHPSGAPHYEAQGMNPGSGYPGSSYRVAQPLPSAPSGSGGSGGYPRLPVAQPVPHALPTGGPGVGPPSSGSPSLSTNRVPIDEVIDKVTAMGFSKSQVRDVVRRLTENGQSVDLNIVLDKLMNGDAAQAPPKGWFGR